MHSPVTDASPLSESPPPQKSPPLRLVVRVETDPQKHEEVVITNKEGHVLMHVPFGRLSCRLHKRERIAFFQAQIENGILELGERAPLAKHWETKEEKKAALVIFAQLEHREREATCVCGAPQHRGLCRDAIAEMKGRRTMMWLPSKKEVA